MWDKLRSEQPAEAFPRKAQPALPELDGSHSTPIYADLEDATRVKD